jgi:hypothetical protein
MLQEVQVCVRVYVYCAQTWMFIRLRCSQSTIECYFSFSIVANITDFFKHKWRK